MKSSTALPEDRPARLRTLPYDAVSAVTHLRASDEALADLIDRIGPCRLQLRTERDPVDALFRAIVFQQLSGRAAATILDRVLALLGEGRSLARAIMDTPVAALRAAGLSRNKVAAVRDLATQSLDGTVATLDQLHSLDNESVIEQLTRIRGVGRWTVEMLLIFNLGRPDVLPLSDLGVRKGFRLVYGMKRLPAPRTLVRAGKRWSPYCSVASWYLWRATDTPA